MYSKDYGDWTTEATPAQYANESSWGRLLCDQRYLPGATSGKPTTLICPSSKANFQHWDWCYSMRGTQTYPAKSTHFKAIGAEIVNSGYKGSKGDAQAERKKCSPSEFPIVFDGLQLLDGGRKIYGSRALSGRDCLGLVHQERSGILFFDGHAALDKKKFNGYFDCGRMLPDWNTKIALPE